MAKDRKIKVGDVEITVSLVNDEDYISLTDMTRAKDGAFFVSDWLRNRNTLEYLGGWESLNNPNFNYGEFAIIKSQAGLNSFKISAKEWGQKTNAIGVFAKAGRYGGTYAHKDIAFNFGMWISPLFQLYVVKEYQRLKKIEQNQHGIEWNVKRILAKTNYKIQTEAIKEHIIPKMNITKDDEWLQYAKEADILNVAVFGCRARDWRNANPKLAKQGLNMRDMASINDLAILSNLESINAVLIEDGLSSHDRFIRLKKITDQQKKSFEKMDFMKSLSKEELQDWILKDSYNTSFSSGNALPKGKDEGNTPRLF